MTKRWSPSELERILRACGFLLAGWNSLGSQTRNFILTEITVFPF